MEAPTALLVRNRGFDACSVSGSPRPQLAERAADEGTPSGWPRRGPLDPWERYRALADHVDHLLDVIELADPDLTGAPVEGLDLNPSPDAALRVSDHLRSEGVEGR